MKPPAATLRLILTVALLGASAQPRLAAAGLVTIASTGGAAPGGGTFGTNFGVPVINAAGQVAFTVQTNPNFPNATDVGVYQGTSSSDLAAVARIGGGLTSVGRGVAENAGGVVVFNANAGTAILGHGTNGLHFLAEAGDVFQPVGGGGPMYTLSSFGDPMINDLGGVAYLASGGVTAFFDDGVVVAYSGQGDLLNGQTVSFSGPVAIDNGGTAAFFGTIAYQAGNRFAIATSNTTNSIVSPSVFSGDDVGGRTLGFDSSSLILGPAGIAFVGSLCNGVTCEGDVFLLQGSTLHIIAKTGDPAPGGGTFSTSVNGSATFVFDAPHMNNNGSIVFVGWTDGGPGHGVYRYTQAHGLEAMALEGHAPYAAAAGFRNAVINNHDVVAFQAFDGSAGNHRGVYLTDGTTTVRAGSDNFFGAEGSSTGAFSRAFFGSQIEGLSPLNDTSQVTFVNSSGFTSQSVMKFSVDPKWVQPGSGTWDTISNWTFSIEPGTESNVTIAGQAAGPLVVTGPAAATTISGLTIGTGPNVAELDLQNTGPFTCTSSVLVFPPGALGGLGTLTASALNIDSSGNAMAGSVTGTLTLNAPVDNAGTMNGDFIFNGDVTNELTASIKGNQTFNGNVTNMGTISPGHSPGTVTVNGDLTLQSTADQGVLFGSDLEIEIGGPNPGDFDVINVTGHVILAGTLHVTFINGFTPTAGQTFHFLNAGSVSGSFDVVTGAVVTPGPGGLDIAPPGTVTSTPKALVKCGAAITKAGASFTAARLKALDACVGGVFKCAQETAAGAKRDACVAKADSACGKDLTKITDLGTKLAGAIDKACGAVGAADVLAGVGVGYQGVATDCANDFNTTLDTLATIEQCVLRAHACRGESLLDAQMPRAKELMRIAGVAQSELDALTCLPDHMGTGDDLGVPKGAGKAVTACEATLTKAGAGFVAKQTKSLAGCLGAVYACVMEKPGDAACLAKAQSACDKAFAAIDTETTTLENAITKACAPPALAFTDLSDPAGAGVDALASDCVALGVASLTTPADYATCLVRRETCDAEDLVRFETPRAGELLALVQRSLTSDFCP